MLLWLCAWSLCKTDKCDFMPSNIVLMKRYVDVKNVIKILIFLNKLDVTDLYVYFYLSVVHLSTIGCISAGHWSPETGKRLANQLNTFSKQCHVSPALFTLLISKSMLGVSQLQRLVCVAQVIGEKKHPCTPGSSSIFSILTCSFKAFKRVKTYMNAPGSCLKIWGGTNAHIVRAKRPEMVE